MERVNKWFGGAFKSSNLPRVARYEPDNTLATGRQLKIWPPVYAPSWYYYQMHQANHWYTNEHNPLDDKEGFEKIDRCWQNALLQSFAALAIGDDHVMSMINKSALKWEESTEWLFTDQGARETTHKIVYNRMLELAHSSACFTVNTLTNDAFVNYLMDCKPINSFTVPDRNETMDKALFLATMILCERYLFAAPFLIINLMSESGLINTCVKINMQVMKDEHVHYLHAVQLWHDLQTPEHASAVDAMFVDLASLFKRLVEQMVLKICVDLPENQKLGVMDHTRFTLRTIFVDCGVSGIPEDVVDYTTTPFLVFDKNTGVDKFNLMESNSTVYKASKTIYIPDWSGLYASVQNEQEEERELKRKRVMLKQ
ncbi:rr2a [Hyphantria cunea granulovirus]|uniref:ribonucleoside-diphosphate reductase n=1 Tax=Hyphantria cunea granulovirus TaxID=307448 RepID=A0AAE6D0L3_9BBAC|nr:rr2a [Hyphantria cunea granulovirus]QBQ01669.1 rr2a [Hyphantria cunea granulovirus]